MKNFRHVLLLGFFCFAFVVGGPAQDVASAEDRATRMSDWMKENLELTDVQYSKVQDLNLRYAYKMEDVRNREDTRSEKLRVAQTLNSTKENELKQILTPDQFTLYEEKKKELQSQFKETLRGSRASHSNR